MENKTDSSMYRVGDIVIGSADPSKSVYSASGTKINPDGVSLFGGDKELTARARDLARSAVMAGGVPLAINKDGEQPKKSKKKSIKQATFSMDNYMASVTHEMGHRQVATETTDLEQPSLKPQVTVQFENDFGKIKAKVENIIEHDLAFLLVYSNEDAVVFEPKIGELLALHTPDKRRLDVYYPGVTFDSPDNIKKFMILFKVPADNQE